PALAVTLAISAVGRGGADLPLPLTYVPARQEAGGEAEPQADDPAHHRGGHVRAGLLLGLVETARRVGRFRVGLAHHGAPLRMNGGRPTNRRSSQPSARPK